MAFLVEIEWPLAGGPPVAPIFSASLKVHDSSDVGGGGATADYKIICILSKSGATKDTQETGLFDPATEPDRTVALRTDATGAHKLVARLVRTNVSPATLIDDDEESPINIAVGGAPDRNSQITITEE